MPFCERKKDVKNSVCVVYYENMVLYYVVDLHYCAAGKKPQDKINAPYITFCLFLLKLVQ